MYIEMYLSCVSESVRTVIYLLRIYALLCCLLNTCTEFFAIFGVVYFSVFSLRVKNPGASHQCGCFESI